MIVPPAPQPSPISGYIGLSAIYSIYNIWFLTVHLRSLPRGYEFLARVADTLNRLMSVRRCVSQLQR